MARPRSSAPGFLIFLSLTLAVAGPVPGGAQVAPEPASAVARLSFQHPDMVVANVLVPVRDLPTEVADAVRPQLAGLDASDEAAYYDLRGDRWGTLVLSRPLLPDTGADEATAWAAFRAYLEGSAGALRVDVRELEPAVTVREGGRLVQINARRTVDGILVRGSLVTAVINSGNLILYGTRNWGTVDVSTRPTVSQEAAAAAVRAYVGAFRGDRTLGQPELVIVTLQNGGDPARVAVGDGYRYRLAWAVRVSFRADHGTWEALIDAHTGERLAFRDLNQYADRKVVGGVFPVSNDGQAPNGIEQAGWPMPFVDIGAQSGGGAFTDSGGNTSCVAAPLQTQLSGPYVRINDNCGVISESAASGDLDLGSGPGTNCDVPPGHSAGDTHSARTGFFEVNRIKEMGRGWLPGNRWLQEQLSANMNIDLECNAFWNGSSINFYRNLGACRNTGEIAAVFDHEWGHGMDDNDALPEISTPGEAPADMYAMLRLNDSCIGRGFFLTGTCTGNGDPCTACTGVREADWAKRASGMPHNIAWIVQGSGPGVPGVTPPGGCLPPPPPNTQVGPCGRGTHCEGGVVTEAVWDLIHRDLAGAPFDMDVNTALNAVARLHYLGGGNVDFWFQCDPTGNLGGCAADSGYMQYLAVDDDNGNLTDGTPHMSAIYAAFDRHQMACRPGGLPSPPVTNGGCAGGPGQAPAVTVTPIDKGARLAWNAVPGAQEYWVFRTDGLHGCAFGKERVAVVSGTQHVDGGLLNGRAYFYTVEAVGASGACRSAASACATVVPTPGPNVRVMDGSVQFQGLTGDGDPFLDNCEHARVSFAVENTGPGAQANVRIVAVEPVSHPDVQITTAMPIPVSGSLASCGSVNASFTLRGDGLAYDDTVRFRVDLASDASPVVRSQLIELQAAESDLEPRATHTFTFDSTDLEDREGWRLVRGTYGKTPGGPMGSSFHLASTTAQNDACDQIRSPLVRLSAESTLSLYNQYNTEPPTPAFGGVFYDRANVGLFDVAAETRTTISPDGGRPYNASGPNGSCVTAGQAGWATDLAGETGAGWAQSTWSNGALQAPAFAGLMARLDVAYGTDPLVSGAGFWFDQVVLTDFELQVPDTQSDECPPVVCETIDDSDPAVDYRKGWHRKQDPAASSGRYHVRVGSHQGGGSTPTARVTFDGDHVTYFFARSSKGGTADVYVDGALAGQVSYLSADASPTFGHQQVFFASGSGPHELRIEHRTGTAYVDGFGFACGGGAQAGAAQFHSETEASTAFAGEGPIITRTVQVGAADREISVLVEGSLVPLTVRLFDPLGNLLATGGALVQGLTESGLDKAVSATGTYTVQVLNPPGAFTQVTISAARMVENP
jgi:hypothetical protein